jgi:hypothetical protein
MAEEKALTTVNAYAISDYNNAHSHLVIANLFGDLTQVDY